MIKAPPPIRMIIDADPGIDDAMAILLAFQSPEVEVAAITTVFGNAGVAKTTANALRLVELAQRTSVPVARGAATPLLRPFLDDGWVVHGRNGLGDVALPAPTLQPDRRPAAQLIIDEVLTHPGGVTIVGLAPLTNLALAARLEPAIVPAVNAVVLMGGAVGCAGNITAVAEANIFHDPEAVSVVLHAGWPITLVGLDVTERVVMTPAYLDALQQHGNPYTDLIAAITQYYLGFYQGLGREGFYVHDPTAMMAVIDRSLFQTESVFVDVEYHSPHHAGQTVADWRGLRGMPPNVDVCVAVDSQRLLAEYARRLGTVLAR